MKVNKKGTASLRSNEFQKVLQSLNQWYPNVLYHTALTGETLQLADVEFEILYTRSDWVDIDGKSYTPTTFSGYDPIDFNDSSSVIRFAIDGGTYINVGDMGTSAEAFLCKTYGELLKSDVMQVSHHGYNTVYNFYKHCAPEVAIYTNNEALVRAWGYQNLGLKILDKVDEYTSGEIYYEGNETIGLSLTGGKPTVVYRGDIIT